MDDLTAARWERLDGLLAEALDRDPDSRTAYLRAACGDDPALYREAFALLGTADEAAGALGESAAAFASPTSARNCAACGPICAFRTSTTSRNAPTSVPR